MAVVSLTVLIFYLFSINNELGELLILLGLFVAAAFRILPAIVRLLFPYNLFNPVCRQLKFYLMSLQKEISKHQKTERSEHKF